MGTYRAGVAALAGGALVRQGLFYLRETMTDDTQRGPFAAAFHDLLKPSTPLDAAPFDFAAFEDVDRADVRIKDPTTGAATAMVITLAGPEHPDRKRLTFARQRRLRAGLAKTGKLQVGDPEDDAADQLDMLVACTLAWSGAAVPYSPAAARALYGDKRRTWLRDQVQAALDERELFTRSSAAT